MINQLQHNLTKQLFVSFFYFLKHFFQCTSSCYHCSKPTEAEARGFLKKIVNYMKCLKRKKSKAMNFLNWNLFFFFFFFNAFMICRAIGIIVRQVFSPNFLSLLATVLHCHSQVAKTAEECCSLVSQNLHPNEVFPVVAPLAGVAEYPTNVSAIKMLQSVSFVILTLNCPILDKVKKLS